RYVGVSNFSGWQVMKALAASDRRGYARVVAQQVYYSLIGRDYEWELMPLGLAENIGAIVWSPLGWGRLTGRIRRSRPEPPSRRGGRGGARARRAPPGPRGGAGWGCGGGGRGGGGGGAGGGGGGRGRGGGGGGATPPGGASGRSGPRPST